MLFVACIVFVVVPTAPPWMAAGGEGQIPSGILEPVKRITWRGWRHGELRGIAHAWGTGRDQLNNVTAVRSLHAPSPCLSWSPFPGYDMAPFGGPC
ncbi:hypothetical protein BH24ACT5_BH24ACT5_09700 [soil metagenome]